MDIRLAPERDPGAFNCKKSQSRRSALDWLIEAQKVISVQIRNYLLMESLLIEPALSIFTLITWMAFLSA